MTINSTSVIGFVGLGVMGGPMCRNIATKHAGRVLALDMNPAAFDILKDTRAQRASSLAVIASQADIIFLSLPGGPQVDTVCLGQDGLIQSGRRDLVIVDLSTTPVSVARKVGSALAEKGIHFADAPVARTREAAQKGELSIMVGAHKALYDQIESLLYYMATDVTHCGAIGCGQVVKLVNNAMVAETTVALAEMMVLGERAGVDPATLLEAVSKGSGDSFVLRNHARKAMLPRNFPQKSFPPEYVIKDLSYVMELAREQGLRPRVTELSQRYYHATANNGWSGHYFPAVIDIIDRNIDIPESDTN